QPHRLDLVLEKLSKVGISGITVTEARGFGRHRGHSGPSFGTELKVNLLFKFKLEIIVEESHVDIVLEAVSGGGYTGKYGDGKIFVCDIDQVMHIQTDETNLDTILI
ncbi:MAG: P-II family nitrogen regulator, partial [Magnetococcales bacterium]|nr:P-II family nitrogen regulator [Magnetococcales bacterium]